MTEIPFSIRAMRIAAVVIGLVVFLVAWNTRDRMWSIWYWLDRIRGGSGDIWTGMEQRGGLKRASYILLGIALILIGIFGESWLKVAADVVGAAMLR